VHSNTNILSDPLWFPHRIDARTGATRFLYLTRAAHRSATFLADEYLRASDQYVDVADIEMHGITRAAAGPTHFVFHSAFCCSTLLARALDLPGTSMGLKEPAVLNDLAMAQRANLAAARFTELLDRTIALLARPLSAGETTVIKPGNVANGLIEPCLRLLPASRVLLMYSRLPTFLRSVASKGLWGRNWARKLYQHLRPAARIDPGFSDAELFCQTDLQIASLAWLMHQAQFADVVRQYGNERVRTLGGDRLVERPEDTLAAVSSFFNLGLTASTIAAAAGSAAFSENSKSHTAGFDRNVRSAAHARVDAAHGEEINMVVTWAEAVARHCGVPMVLEASLLE
jgi:hypothetical protein